MSGEGRGHATRVKAIVEGLRQQHQLILFASGQAYEMLAPLYHHTDVQVRQLEGLSFCYREDGRLDYFRTCRESIFQWLGFPARIEALKRQMLVERPMLVITDFEPILPRAAEQLGIPYLSIDHQHFLSAYDLGALPWRLRWYAWLMSMTIRMFYGSQLRTIISAFYFPPLKKNARNTFQVGTLMGEDVLSLEPRNDGFMLVYLRREVPRRVLRALRDLGIPVRIYGLGQRKSEQNLEFLEIDRAGFIEDLARCQALLCTAGNQLVGEALFLGKPILVVPERGNWEQEVNGFFLSEMKAGVCMSMHQLKSGRIQKFLNDFNAESKSMYSQQFCGNTDVIGYIQQTLEEIEQGRIPWGEEALFRRAPWMKLFSPWADKKGTLET